MHFLVRTTDRLILSYGEPADSPRPGVEVVEASATVLAQIMAAYSSPNGGVSLDADGTVTALPVPPAPPPPPLASDEIMAIPDIAAMPLVARTRVRLAVKKVVP